jgi:hypothetical protein
MSSSSSSSSQSFESSQSSQYIETDQVLGVSFVWHNSHLLEKTKTRRGTTVEIVERPVQGLTCYMNGSIQSCLSDESLYHSSLLCDVIKDINYIHSIGNLTEFRVCIFGGGEGCVARDIFKYGGNKVSTVDMFEWDPDVVQLFKWKYNQWTSREVWNDPRLRIHFEDAFEIAKQSGRENSYELVVVDLFEIPDWEAEGNAEGNPEGNTEGNAEEIKLSQWKEFITSISSWTTCNMVVYAGLYYPGIQTGLGRGVQKCAKWMKKYGNFADIKVKSVYIPSFHAEAVFIEGYK